MSVDDTVDFLMEALLQKELSSLLRATVNQEELEQFKCAKTIPVFGVEQRVDVAYLHAIADVFYKTKKEDYKRRESTVLTERKKRLEEECKDDGPLIIHWPVHLLPIYYPKNDVLSGALRELLNDERYDDVRKTAYGTLARITGRRVGDILFGPTIPKLGEGGGPTPAQQRAIAWQAYNPQETNQQVTTDFWTRRLFVSKEYQTDMMKLYWYVRQ